MSEGPTNGFPFRVTMLERQTERHDSRLREIEVHLATHGEQVVNLTREVHGLSTVFDKRFDRLNARMDDEVKGLRRLFFGICASAIGGTLMIAVSLGIH